MTKLERNRIACKKWRDKNKEYNAIRNKEWREDNPGRQGLANFNLNKKNMMKWSDYTREEQDLLDMTYKNARDLTKATGILYEVDHIIPIALGGKHEPSNLQILTGVENHQKGAR